MHFALQSSLLFQTYATKTISEANLTVLKENRVPLLVHMLQELSLLGVLCRGVPS
jgi:hypothetical protein